jgi:hypothetical protein
MAIFANVKYFGNEQTSKLDVDKMCQRHIKRFMLISFTIAARAFDIMVSLNIDCSTSKEDVDRTSRTHTSLRLAFWGYKMQL